MAAKAKKQETIHGTGRRKSAVARVRLLPGTGKILVNLRPIEKYFPHASEWATVRAPLESSGCGKEVDAHFKISGGGYSGQAGAARLGIARALICYKAELEEVLREKKFLTVDARRKERKKYGKAGARKSFQFSKR